MYIPLEAKQTHNQEIDVIIWDIDTIQYTL